jgi:SulP family sulfate permease
MQNQENKIFANIFPLSRSSMGIELLAGLTVALALVPEAIAFAFVAGVNPLVGLYAAFMVGLITALIGGRPGMISGATGALAVVMVSLVAVYGVEYLFATVVLMGLIQIIFGFLRWGRFIRLVPHSVMLGFVNGLAIVIGLAQLEQFRASGNHDAEWLSDMPLIIMLSLVFLTMAVIWLTPKITKSIPAPLMGISVVAAIVIYFGIDVPRVGDMASIAGGFPDFHVPQVPINIETLIIILPYALILSAIGLIESLLTLNLVGEMVGDRGGASQESVAQGVANVATGFFGGMGGCAMIGQSMINVNSGGRTRFAAVASALFLLLFILVASPIIEQIPLAALVGVMFMVVIGTFAWRSILILRKVPKSDAFVTILVTAVTVATDLATAVIVGVIFASLTYAWHAAKHIKAKSTLSKDGQTKVYELEGPLFFGSCEGFSEIFDPSNDPISVIVDFAKSRVVDQSAIQSIEALSTKYEALDKTVQLRHLSRDCHALLSKAGHLIIDSDDDPNYAVAADYGVKTGIFGSH